MLSIASLIRWQSIYALLGITYNVISLFRLEQDLKGLSSTDPIAGIVVMSIYASFLIPGRLGYHKIYRALMVLAIIILGYGGVITHIKNLFHAPELYLNTSSAILAIVINLFGLILNMVGASGKYKQ